VVGDEGRAEALIPDDMGESNICEILRSSNRNNDVH
jgi:hypothetical protein